MYKLLCSWYLINTGGFMYKIGTIPEKSYFCLILPPFSPISPQCFPNLV